MAEKEESQLARYFNFNYNTSPTDSREVLTVIVAEYPADGPDVKEIRDSDWAKPVSERPKNGSYAHDIAWLKARGQPLQPQQLPQLPQPPLQQPLQPVSPLSYEEARVLLYQSIATSEDITLLGCSHSSAIRY